MDQIIQRIFPRMKTKGVDSTQGVKVLAFCFVAYFLVSGGFKANPIFYEAFYEEFNVTRHEADWPSTVYNFVTNMSGIVLAPLANRFTVRPVAMVCTLLGAIGCGINFFIKDLALLSVTFGGGGGLSFGMMVMTISVLMTQYFKEYRTTAIAAVFAGGATGGFVYPSMLQFLYNNYGYHILMLGNGLIILSCLPICYFLREPDFEEMDNEGTTSQPVPKASLREQLTAVREPAFYVILIPALSNYWSTATCITTMVNFAKEKGYSGSQGKHLTEALGVLEMIGQLFLPILCHRGYISNEWMAFIVYCLSGVMFIIWAICPTYLSMMILLVFTGPAFGLSCIMYRVFVGDYVGMHRMKMVFGLLVGVKGVLTFAVPAFLEFFVDEHDDYNGMFILCGSIAVLVSCMWIPMAIKKMRESGRTIQEEELQNYAHTSDAKDVRLDAVD